MKLTEGGRLDRPNLCWICQRTPGPGEKVIDTEKYFDGFPVNLQGRQYVCERCATEMFKFFDYASLEDVRLARHEEEQAKAILRGLKVRLDSLASDLVNISVAPQNFTQVGDPNLSQTSNAQGGSGTATSNPAAVLHYAEAEAPGGQSVEDREGEDGFIRDEDRGFQG